MPRSILLLTEFKTVTVSLVESLLARIESTAGIPYRTVLVQELTSDDLDDGTFPFIVRGANHWTYALVRHLRRLGIRYGYYIDDNVWELDPAHRDGQFWRSALVTRELATIVGAADPFLVSTKPLQAYLSPQHGDRVHQVESFFDFSIVPELPPAPRRAGSIRGGFASSPGRVTDLALVLPDVLNALQTHPNLEFEVIGAEADALPQHERLRAYPYLHSYDEYIRFQLERQWDFGLAPLAETASNRYKTNNKYREYAAYGIPGIYQDALSYAEVRDGETGLVAGSHRSWGEAIDLLLASERLRSDIRRNARRDAEARLSLETIAPMWAQYLLAAPGMSARAGRKLARALPSVRRAYRDSQHWGIRRYLSTARLFIAADGFWPTARRTLSFLRRRRSSN